MGVVKAIGVSNIINYIEIKPYNELLTHTVLVFLMKETSQDITITSERSLLLESMPKNIFT